MVNVILYLNNDSDPVEIIQELLSNELIAIASMDIDNKSYLLKDGVLVRETHTIITCQTKSILFNEICEFISTNFKGEIRINSVPIIASNEAFENSIRLATKNDSEVMIRSDE